MYFLDDHLIIGHVGDSRCYRARGTEITQLTEDHSLINDYIRMKRVTPEEAENWPHKNVIVRALGMKESVQVDIITRGAEDRRHLPAVLRRADRHDQGRSDRGTS